MNTILFAGINWWDIISIIITIGLLVASAIIDKRSLKIPNFLTFPGFIVGAVLCVFSNGFGEMGLRFIAVAVLFLGYMIKLLSGGDTKLLMAVTMLQGILGMLITLILANVVLLVWKLIKSRHEAVNAIREGLFLMNGSVGSPYSNGDNERKISFAPYLLIGFLLYTAGRIVIGFIS